MKIPERTDCIHHPVCKYDDQMCATDCGYLELLSSDDTIRADVLEFVKSVEAYYDVTKHLQPCSWTRDKMLEKCDKVRSHFADDGGSE